MDRDGHPRSHEEDPLQQIDPWGIDQNNEPERPRGDVLSDGWTPGHEPARVDGDDSSDLVWVDQERVEDHEQSESLEGFEYLYRSEGDEASHDHERPDGENWDPDGEEDRGYLGSGWTGENDLEEEKKGGKNKQLILAMVAIVVLAVAGGWIVSTSVGSKPDAACSTPGHCASVQQDPALTDGPTVGPSLTDPATESTAGTDETTAPPSETPTPTASQVRHTRQPTSRPTPTRTRAHPPQPSPTSSSLPQQPETPNPQPSPTPPPTTQAPKPAPSPTKTQDGGLLGWLF
ncbi:hypothetical protein [Sphaerisporangium perillae]|uniref:hypothetical protein n=1 Tax=Sphaerisporangium perillae TaxID=2935860 RepID=UPI00200CDCB0|nr:hypothetical protein [Sphaerisporangium perillae]